MPVGIAIGATAAVSTGVSIYQGNKAEQSREHASKLKTEVDSAKNRRQRRKQLRDARVARAAIRNQAVAEGTSESSSVVGQQGSVSSQAAANIGAINVSEGASRGITSAGKRASRADFRAGLATSVGELGMAVIGASAAAKKATPDKKFDIKNGPQHTPVPQVSLFDQ